MVRADVLRQRLDVLLDAISDLRRYREAVSREQLSSDRDAQHMVLHAMYVATQSAIDIALHAAADAGEPAAQSYRDAFRYLGRAGLLEADLAERMAGWAGLRNVLAHYYAVVDYDLVYEALQSDLAELEQFAVAAATWIEPADSVG
ncbi:DUF86 domain-containing protein [Planctomycetota bacterium]